MVSPLSHFYKKLLHCRELEVKVVNSPRLLNSKKEIDVDSGERSHGTSDLNGTIKDESTDDLCRVCLRDGIIPIFEITTNYNIANDLLTIGGIEVSIDDPYPKKICKPCHALLEGAMLLRKNAQHTDELLRNEVNEPAPIIEEDFRNSSSDKEEANNLHTQNENTSSFGYNNNDLIIRNVNTSKMFKLIRFIDQKTYNKNLGVQEGKVVKGLKIKDLCSNLRCIQCNERFETFEKYSEHRLTYEHENNKSTCRICNKLFHPNYLKNHIASHNQEEAFICDICGKQYGLQTSFNRHLMTHSTDLPFECPICPFRGRFSDSLKMHMRSHTGERPYQCAECKGRFVSKSNLIKHMRMHVDRHDFKCEICERAYYTKRERDEHIRAYHKGIKEHVCSICHKSFGYRKQRMRHERKVHNREKLRPGIMPSYLALQT